MNILILGGSGILSSDFTKKTIKENNDVYVVNRGRRENAVDSILNIIIADIRLESVNNLRRKIAVRQYDVVVDFLTYNVNQMKKTLSVIEGICKQYIFISSATAYLKKSENDVITENMKVGNSNWDYAFNKALCEEYLKKQKCIFTIIRPYVTYGKTRIPFPIIPDRYHYTLIQRMKENKPVLLYNNGAAICTLTNTIDFAEILYRLLLNEKAYNEDFHITSSSEQTWKAVYLILCDILKVQPNYLSVNSDEVSRFLPEFYDVLLGDKGTNMRFCNQKVIDAIGGYEFKVELNTGLRESIEYFETNNKLQALDFKWDGRCDYLIKRIYGKKYKMIQGKDYTSSNLKCMYYIMSNLLTRTVYDYLKKFKLILKHK